MNSLFQKPLSFEEDFPIPSYSEWEKLAKSIYNTVLPDNKYLIENIEVKPLYTKEDRPHNNFPLYFKNEKNWQITQEIVASEPSEFNRAVKNSLNGGAESLSLTLNPYSLMGLNGKTEPTNSGLLIKNYSDFKESLKGISLEEYPLYIQSGIAGTTFLTFLQSYIDENGLSPLKVSGSIEIDPLWILGRFGQINKPIAMLYDEMAAAVKWTHSNVPNIKTVGVNVAYLHETGASAVHELAFAMGSSAEYIHALLERNTSIEDIIHHFHFNVSVGSDFFMNIAKLRALRLLWANLTDAFGATGDMKINCRTSKSEKTVTEPHTNIIRFTLQSMAAVIGGCDSMMVGDFRESDDFTQRIARNTLLILKKEAKFNAISNAAAGSFFIENLTKKLAEKAWILFQKVEKEGGLYSVLQKEFPLKGW